MTQKPLNQKMFKQHERFILTSQAEACSSSHIQSTNFCRVDPTGFTCFCLNWAGLFVARHQPLGSHTTVNTKEPPFNEALRHSRWPTLCDDVISVWQNVSDVAEHQCECVGGSVLVENAAETLIFKLSSRHTHRQTHTISASFTWMQVWQSI